MPKRNIGWRWHLASFPEITAWQLEVNKSWSCEKLFPSLLPSLLLSSLQRQTPQHVFHILASQFIELLSGSWLSHRLAPTPLSVPPKSGGGELGRGWSAPVAGWGAETWEDVRARWLGRVGCSRAGLDACTEAAEPARNPAQVCLKTSLCNYSAAGAVTRKVVATEMRRPQTPLSLTGKDGSLPKAAPLLCLPVGSSRFGRWARFVHRTICCPLVLLCTGGLTWKPGGSLCGDSVIACELSGEAVSSATALTVRSTLCLESFWL